MKPHSHEEHIQHSFDAFCKKVLRNEARDYQDALARKRNREVYFSELPVEVLEQFAVRDTYFTDSRTFEVIGHSVCIDDETLAEAISALPVDRRDFILLSYFLDMSDAEIANALNMVRRSVAYRRTSTLKLLKKPDGGRKQMPGQSKNNRLFPLPVIEAAAGGDVEAINAVLKHYAGYIARLSMRELYDEYGNPHLCVDEELRRRLETKLITKLLTFRVR